METKEITKWLMPVLIAVLVVSLGLFAVNQALAFRYKAEFLKAPCKLCMDLNPNVTNCILIKQNLYSDGKGGWTNESPYKNNMSNIISKINLSG